MRAGLALGTVPPAMAAHASTDDVHADPQPPPGLPEIQDEAADTPMWVPALGLALFVLAAVWLVVSAAFEDAAPEAEAGAEIAAPAEAAPAPEPAAPAAPH